MMDPIWVIGVVPSLGNLTYGGLDVHGFDDSRHLKIDII